jgi:DNA-binding GntR family transcriptional regulator
MALAPPTTRTGAVYLRIRDEILRGMLEPGQRLRLVELAQRCSVSQSVVREVLTRLAEQGLVVALPQQGFRVVSLTAKDLDELTEARAQVESLVLRLSIQRGDLHWESSLVAAHHTLAATPESTPDGAFDNEEWFEVHERFHLALLEGCANDRLLGITVSLRDSAALYRRWSRPIGRDFSRDVAGEHRALLDAALARDANLASARLVEHLQRTTAVLRDVISDA